MLSPFLFVNANTPWVYALAERLAYERPTHAMRLYDWLVYWRNKPQWPEGEMPINLTRSLNVLPTGYAGSLERVSRPFMRGMIRRRQSSLRAKSGTEPWTVAPYPYLAPWLSQTPDERLIYYNLDAYTLYRPERAASIRENEKKLVKRAAFILCLSQFQVHALRGRYPEQADRVYHFPLGVVEDFINPDPQSGIQLNSVGYIGNMTNRVDWQLINSVARRLSDVRFVFVGKLEELETGVAVEGWKEVRRRTLALPNVEHVGRVPQEAVKEYYWSFAVNWIPYNIEHPFNKASCPTKVMDSIASGRPIVSTSVPECTLYPDWITIANSVEETGRALERSLSASHNAELQVAFARQHTWEVRANQLTSIIADAARA